MADGARRGELTGRGSRWLGGSEGAEGGRGGEEWSRGRAGRGGWDGRWRKGE